MIVRKDGIRIPARAAIAVALAAVLAACSAHTSTSSTTNVPSAANVADTPARESDLPEIVVTARALHPGEPSVERAGASQAPELSIPSYIGKSPLARARKARAPSSASNESG